MKYTIVVSGAAVTRHCSPGVLELAKQIGREIVRQGGVLVTGATSGIPYWAAIGAKEEAGTDIQKCPYCCAREQWRHTLQGSGRKVHDPGSG